MLLHLYGKLLFMSNKDQESLQILKQALKINKKNSDIHFDIGNIYVKNRLTKKATESYLQSFQYSQKPNELLLINLGNLFFEDKQYKKAINFFSQAKKKNPQNFYALKKIFTCYIQLINLEKNLLKKYDTNKELEKLVLGELDRESESYEINAILSSFYESCNQYALAKNYYEKSLDINFNIDQALSYADFLIYIKKQKEAFDILKKIESTFVTENLSLCYLMMGKNYFFTNDKENAKRYFSLALQNEETFPEALYLVNKIENYKNNHPLFNKAEKLIKENKLNDEHLIHLYNFLADVNESSNSPENLFKYLKVIKEKRKEKIKINDTIDALKIINNDKLVEKLNLPIFKEELLKPIFVVGMPRSGSTLVDQIISSHPDTFSVGESSILTDFLQNFENCEFLQEYDLSGFSNYLTSVRQSYIKQISFLNTDQKPFFIDKNLFNFKYINVILKMFPQARIIRVNRSPIENCWSIYRNHFAENIRWTLDLTSIINYFKQQKILFDFWTKKYASNILNISYLDLVNNPEHTIRKIINFCDLEWCDICLTPEKNLDSVLTLSTFQVRKKINNSSIEAWRKYDYYLSELINAFPINKK